ncbi:MAG: hypothetical protein M1828_007208 [Chrysothrix sp. TS-e1954]|nr:MAG: hypothetical protein M1828_007208 [Chrysothrix sp. TS-e1954]
MMQHSSKENTPLQNASTQTTATLRKLHKPNHGVSNTPCPSKRPMPSTPRTHDIKHNATQASSDDAAKVSPTYRKRASTDASERSTTTPKLSSATLSRLSAPRTATAQAQTLRVKSSCPPRSSILPPRRSISVTRSPANMTRHTPQAALLQGRVDELVSEKEEQASEIRQLKEKLELVECINKDLTQDRDNLNIQYGEMRARAIDMEDPLMKEGCNICGCQSETEEGFDPIIGKFNTKRSNVELFSWYSGSDAKHRTLSHVDMTNWELDIPCLVCGKSPSRVALKKRRDNRVESLMNAEAARFPEKSVVYKKLQANHRELEARNVLLSRTLARRTERSLQILWKLQGSDHANKDPSASPDVFDDIFMTADRLIKTNTDLRNELEWLQAKSSAPHCKEYVLTNPGSVGHGTYAQCSKARKCDEIMAWLPRLVQESVVCHKDSTDPAFDRSTFMTDKEILERLFREWKASSETALTSGQFKNEQHVSAAQQCTSGASVAATLTSADRTCARHAAQNAVEQMRKQTHELVAMIWELRVDNETAKKQNKIRASSSAASSDYSEIAPQAASAATQAGSSQGNFMPVDTVDPRSLSRTAPSPVSAPKIRYENICIMDASVMKYNVFSETTKQYMQVGRKSQVLAYDHDILDFKEFIGGAAKIKAEAKKLSDALPTVRWPPMLSTTDISRCQIALEPDGYSLLAFIVKTHFRRVQLQQPAPTKETIPAPPNSEKSKEIAGMPGLHIDPKVAWTGYMARKMRAATVSSEIGRLSIETILVYIESDGESFWSTKIDEIMHRMHELIPSNTLIDFHKVDCTNPIGCECVRPKGFCERTATPDEVLAGMEFMNLTQVPGWQDGKEAPKGRDDSSEADDSSETDASSEADDSSEADEEESRPRSQQSWVDVNASQFGSPECSSSECNSSECGPSEAATAKEDALKAAADARAWNEGSVETDAAWTAEEDGKCLQCSPEEMGW